MKMMIQFVVTLAHSNNWMEVNYLRGIYMIIRLGMRDPHEPSNSTCNTTIHV